MKEGQNENDDYMTGDQVIEIVMKRFGIIREEAGKHLLDAIASGELTPYRTIPIQEQIKCVEREIAMRRCVYAKWVSNNRMKQETADREIAAMGAVLDTLCVLAIRENPSLGRQGH